MKYHERLSIAKSFLTPFETDYRILYEDPEDLESSMVIITPDANWMAAAMFGGIVPPVWVFLELDKDEKQPGFTKHTRGHLIHETEPLGPMTEEEAVYWLAMRRVPRHIWEDQSSNRKRFAIVRSSQVPEDETFRDAWNLAA